MRRSIIVILVLLALVASVGCAAATVAPKEIAPAVVAPVEPSEQAVTFSIVSTITTDLGRVISCIYVDGFKDDASVWEKIRSYGVLLGQSQAKNGGFVPVAAYFFDDMEGVITPEIMDGYALEEDYVEGQAPHCVASVETGTNGTVNTIKYPCSESKSELFND